MSYQVIIKRNSDGLERVRSIDWDWFKNNSDTDDLWWWTEGNFGCDCNREWEFQRAGGEPISKNPLCGGNRYTVIKAILPDGREIIIDAWQEAQADKELETAIKEALK